MAPRWCTPINHTRVSLALVPSDNEMNDGTDDPVVNYHMDDINSVVARTFISVSIWLSKQGS